MRLLGVKNVSELGPKFVSFPILRPHVPRPWASGRTPCLGFLLAITTDKVTPSQINTRRVERDIYDGEPGLDKRGLWAGLTKAKL